MKLAAIILTYNSQTLLPALFDGVALQALQPDEIIVMDSNSRDSSRDIAAARGARVYTHGVRKFNHGGTRRWASELTDADILIYLTHDAVPADAEAFAHIVAAIKNVPDAGMAFGRQLPNPGAGTLGRHHRMFNYPAESKVKRLADARELGIKTCFASDSFSAYRRDRLMEIGGFPQDVISCEDQFVAARLLIAGYAVVYAGDARVYHSHDYSITEEFKRYFDSGAFFAMHPWIMQKFGSASGEGKRFVESEARYLLDSGHWYLLPKALIGSVAKFAGFKAGLSQARLSNAMKRKFGMHSAYWCN
jgi:rhamnosyltransferase